MTFVVPSYTAPGQAWQLTDYKPALTLTGKADNTGTATLTAPSPVDPGNMWAIQRAVVTSSSTSAPQVRLYDSPVTVPVNLLSGSNAGNYDEADYPAGPGLLVDQSRQLVAVFTGCDPGAACTVRFQIGVLSLVRAG